MIVITGTVRHGQELVQLGNLELHCSSKGLVYNAYELIRNSPSKSDPGKWN